MNYLQISIEFVLFFIETVLCFVFCNVFRKERNKFNLRVMIPTIVCTLLLTFTNNSFKMFSPINTVVILIIMILTQYAIFRNDFSKISLAVFVYRGMITATTYTVMSIGYHFVGFNYNALDSNYNIIFSQRDLPLFLSELVAGILVFAFKNSVIRLDNVSKLLKVAAVFLSTALFMICILFPWFGSGEVYCFAYQYVYENVLSVTELVSVVMFMSLFLFQIIKPIALNLYKRKLDLAEIKYTMLQNSLDETERSFELWKQSVHDYKNNIIALRQLAEDGKLDEIKEYLNKESNLLENKMFYIKTGNSTADAVINTKYSKAKNKGIRFVVNAQLDDCPVSDIEFARILGNLLDNAIESAENETEPYISVNIRRKKTFLIINITNKFTGELTTATNKNSAFHGIGLKSIKRIVSKYEGEFTISHKDNEVSAKILIP